MNDVSWLTTAAYPRILFFVGEDSVATKPNHTPKQKEQLSLVCVGEREKKSAVFAIDYRNHEKSLGVCHFLFLIRSRS